MTQSISGTQMSTRGKQSTPTQRRTVRHLQAARVLRSVSQGIAVVDLTLYLKQLHWSARAIGGTLSAAALVGAALILLVGFTSDRVGRKPFLVVYEVMTTLAALVLVFTANPIWLTVIIVITGFGRGQNGAAGPFTPAEQAWMAACVPQQHRGRVFSVNNALGFFGMAIGAMLAGTNRLFVHLLPGTLSFRPLFLFMCILSAICIVVLISAPKEIRPGSQTGNGASAATQRPSTPAAQPSERIDLTNRPNERDIRGRENRNMLRLASVNLLNGLAVGFIGPMMAYWFATKFGVSTAQIGVTLALSFVCTSVSSLVTGRLTERFGMVRAVVILQICGVLMLLIMPLMPSFTLASVMYVARSALARGTQGARSALSTSLTRDQRRGFSVSMNALVMRLSSVAGPTVSGYIFDLGWLSLPFYLAACLQFSSSMLYGRLFRSFDRPSHVQAD